MKKIILIFILICSFIYGQRYQMNINLKNGEQISFLVADIQKLTFENLTNIKDKNEINNIIKSFKVSQNYPNPFNPQTKIIYQISKPSIVKVCIYDIQGSLVKELFNDYQEMGEYELVWNGTNQSNQKISSGIYFYSVSAEGQTISKQMILIK